MKAFKNIFTKPSAESRPWAIWIWNLTISKDELLRQLNLIIEQGYGGVAIKPGRDMVPSFLSEEFMDLFGLTLGVAEQKGIGVRFVADLGLPWNLGIDQLVNANRDFRAQRLVLEREETVPARTLIDRTVADYRSAMVMITKMRDGKAGVTESKVLNLNSTRGQISWKAPTGEWKLLTFRKCDVQDPAGSYLPNVFNVKVAHAYVQNVLDVLRARFSKQVPCVFKGVILEMPPIIPSDGGIPWDDDLVVKYRAKFKKELLTLLPVIFCEVDPGLNKNRSHVYNHLLQSSFERFAFVTEAWARKNRMTHWTLSATRSLGHNENAVRDFLCLPETGLSVSGVQNMGGTEEDYHVVYTNACVNASEFKRQTVTVLGRNRIGTGSTVQGLKSELDLAMLMGNSTILVDGLHFNLDQRNLLKSPFNPFWYSPDAAATKAFCNYAAHLHEATAGLSYDRQVAVLNPWESVLADYLPSNDESIKKGVTVFRNTVIELRRTGLDFEIINEPLLLKSSVKDTGEFVPADKARKGLFKALVVPASRLISKSLLVFIERIAAKKGTVLFVDEAPQGSFEDGITRSFTERVEKLLASKKACIRTVTAQGLGEMLAGLSPQVSASVGGKRCADISCLAGHGDDFTAYFFSNTSDTLDYFASVELPQAKTIAVADCAKGDIQELLGAAKADGKMVFSLNFAPRQSYLILAGSGKGQPSILKKDKKNPLNAYGTTARNYRIVLKDQWNFKPLSLNSLPLATWNMRIGLSRESGGFSHFYDATFLVKEVPRLCMLAWCGLPQRSQEFGGLDKALEISINGNRLPLSAALKTTPNPELTPELPSYFANTLMFDVRTLVQRGFNRVSLRTIGSYSDPMPLAYPASLLGDFSIIKGSNGWVIDTPLQTCGYDSWTHHGFPYFTGVGSYKQIFEIPSTYQRLIMRFNRLSGSADALLNGKPLGHFDWPQMEVDVTDACESKRNELELRVTNSIDNILRMNGRLSGILGEVHLDVY